MGPSQPPDTWRSTQTVMVLSRTAATSSPLPTHHGASFPWPEGSGAAPSSSTRHADGCVVVSFWYDFIVLVLDGRGDGVKDTEGESLPRPLGQLPPLLMPVVWAEPACLSILQHHICIFSQDAPGKLGKGRFCQGQVVLTLLSVGETDPQLSTNPKGQSTICFWEVAEWPLEEFLPGLN